MLNCCPRSYNCSQEASRDQLSHVCRTPANSCAQWDRCLSSMLIRSGLGLSFGVVFSVLLFKRRAWPATVGLGFGAGRAWEECDNVRLHRHTHPVGRC
jgi:hypothetical protein